MHTPRISIIAAIGKNRELGKNGDLIWRISADLKRVKTLTVDHTLIMGRKTYESIGKPLPERTTIIVTRNETYSAPKECIVATSFEEALARARGIEKEEIFIFGGAEIYTHALPFTDRLYLTIVDGEDPDADTFFPDYSDFSEVIQKEKEQEDCIFYTYTVLEKTSS